MKSLTNEEQNGIMSTVILYQIHLQAKFSMSSYHQDANDPNLGYITFHFHGIYAL